MRSFWRRFFKHRAAMVGLAVAFLLVAVAGVAPQLAPHSPYSMDLTAKYQPPDAAHLLGTDEFGRDILSRIIYGSRIVVGIAISATVLASIGGIGIGLLAGMMGGWADLWVMRGIDVMMAFPAFLLATGLAAVLGPTPLNLVIVIAVTRAPHYARLIRGSVLAVREMEYVEAARSVGATLLHTAVRHVLPNCVGPILVYASLTLGDSILIVSGLSFLGIGIQPPTADWGVMLARGREYLLIAPWVPFFPGLAIFLTVMAFNLMGDGLRDTFDIA